MSSIFDSEIFNQNLFFPRRDNSSPPENSEEIFVEVEEGIEVHLRRYPNPKNKFSILYFHGNGEIVSDYNSLAGEFHNLGAELIVSDYRGYGKSDGRPTMRSLLEDSHRILRGLKERGKIEKNLALMGRSLGSAPAIELAARAEGVGALVLESGYSDPVGLAARRGINLGSLSEEEARLFDNGKKMAEVTCPLLVLHGEKDRLIEAEEGRKNYRQAGSEKKEIHIISGVGHNDILRAREEYFGKLKEFFKEIFGA